MIDREINDFVRVISSIALSQQKRECLTEYLIKNNAENKTSSVKYVAAASAAAVLVISSLLIARGKRQDINIM